MKKVSMILAAMALMLGTQLAQARVEAPVYNCSVAFDIQGGGIKIFLGSFKLAGPGEVTCIDIAGNTETFPVRVTMGGQPLSLGLAIGQMRLVGLATGVGITGSPQDIAGDYLVASIRGSLIVGAGADLALHATDRALTLNAAVQVVTGLGANIGLDFLTIETL